MGNFLKCFLKYFYFVHDIRAQRKHLKYSNQLNAIIFAAYEYIFRKNKMLENRDHNFLVDYYEFSFIIERGKSFLYFPSVHIYASRSALIRDMSNFSETGNAHHNF